MNQAINRIKSLFLGMIVCNRTSRAFVLLLTVFQQGVPASAAGPADDSALRSAWTLYSQKKYSASADAFEALIRTSTPNARLYYYAAAANQSSNRLARAKQLCQYIVANFPASAEAGLAQKMCPDSSSNTASASGNASGGVPDALPASLKGKSLDELMQTEEGRKALKEALQQKRGATASPKASSAPPSDKSKGGTDSARASTDDLLAVDGPDGITQFVGHPQCWLECSMAALAMLPRGQTLITSMIRPTQTPGTYIVRFPGGDGVEYTISQQKLEEARVRDKALWATLIHIAQLMKVRSPSDVSIEAGLTCLTGKKAEKVYAANTTEQTLKQFIAGAIKSQEPVVCLSADDFGAAPELAEADHAYTITDIDTATGMITIRNPHGDNSRRFRLKTDPEHQKFEQLNGGVFKMHISLFPKYFSEVARASI
jgi:tetratricopeptide (TPR) repeat protein